MNTIKYISLALILSGLWSCEDGALDPVVRPGSAPVISNPGPGTSFVLSESQASSILTTIEWSAADFGFQAGVSYNVQLDMAGNNFADAVTLGTVAGISLDVTQDKINNILLSSGIEEAIPVNIEIRVRASVSPEVERLTSDPVALTVTPFIVEVVYPQLQVPGGYQGWDPSNNNTVIFSVRSDLKYEGFIYFPDDNTEFKYTDGPTWDVNYGDDGADGTLENGSSNIIAPQAGLYRLSVNLNDLTHSFTRTIWGVLGDATPGGWDTDQDMSYDPATGILSVTLNLTAGEIKFRANDAWDINFGDDGANGSVEYNGANIAITEAGNYTIELILSVAKYRYRLTKN